MRRGLLRTVESAADKEVNHDYGFPTEPLPPDAAQLAFPTLTKLPSNTYMFRAGRTPHQRMPLSRITITCRRCDGAAGHEQNRLRRRAACAYACSSTAPISCRSTRFGGMEFSALGVVQARRLLDACPADRPPAVAQDRDSRPRRRSTSRSLRCGLRKMSYVARWTGRCLPRHSTVISMPWTPQTAPQFFDVYQAATTWLPGWSAEQWIADHGETSAPNGHCWHAPTNCLWGSLCLPTRGLCKSVFARLACVVDRPCQSGCSAQWEVRKWLRNRECQ